MEAKFIINSIYSAIEGEGVHVGTPQVMVRFQGCHIGCLNCDSKDTWDFSTGYKMTLNEVMNRISSLSHDGLIKRISITGGDPLHPMHTPQVLELTKALKEKNYFVNIEAAGTRIVKEIFDLVDFISFDFKTPSTGVKTNPELFIQMNEEYAHKFQVKAVVADEKDFHAVLNLKEWVRSKVEQLTSEWCLTPAYEPNEAFPTERFHDTFMLNLNSGSQFRVIGQQHKWVYGADRKQV